MPASKKPDQICAERRTLATVKQGLIVAVSTGSILRVPFEERRHRV